MSLAEQPAIRVSTIIPVYNGAATIAAAIDSALAQDFAGQEIIVVNDGSTDGTAEVLAGYGERIRVINRANGGVSAARNAGIAVACGEYIALLDADDLWLQGHLTSCVAELDSSCGAVVCFAGYIPVMNGQELPSRIWHLPPTLAELLKSDSFILPSVTVMRRDRVVECGGFPAGYGSPGFEDTYFYLLLAERGSFRCVSRANAIYNAPPFSEIGYKYATGFTLFIQVVAKRYGSAADGLVARARAGIAASLLTRAIEKLDQRKPREALAALWRMALLDPLFLPRRVNPLRLFLPRNLRRVCRAASAAVVRRAPRVKANRSA